MAREMTVVGGGAVGLGCALAAADAGWRVRVYDAGPEGRAAQVAGGMLGCLGEAHPGEDALLAVSADSVARWPALLERLGDPQVQAAASTLLVAGSATDRAHLDEQAAYLRLRLPQAVLEPVSAGEIREAETALSRNTAGGYRLRGEGAVDNRRLLAALRRAVTAAGGEFAAPGRVSAGDLVSLPGDQLLVAAGLGSAELLPGWADELGLRGEKGEILRLRRTGWSVPPPEHVVRGRWHGRNVYLVPRADGVVVGATQYEADGPGDLLPQAGGVADLLLDACELMPGLRTYELLEAGAGIRPVSRDGVPVVRRLDDRLLVAAGHGRNGIALTPGTAAQVVDLLGEPG